MARLESVVARHDGILAGLTSDGAIFQQARASGGLRWQPIDPPESSGLLVHLAYTSQGILLAVNSREAVFEQQGDGVLGSKPQWQPVDMAGLDAA